MFMILDLETGNYDGWYARRQVAEELRDDLAAQRGGRWVVLSLVNKGESSYIPQCAADRRRAFLNGESKRLMKRE